MYLRVNSHSMQGCESEMISDPTPDPDPTFKEASATTPDPDRVSDPATLVSPST